MKKRRGRIISEAMLVAVAGIIGGQSAAGAAINDLALRRARGENPVCIQTGSTYIVGDEAAIRNDFIVET